ncbi:hypothetical protein TCAL_10080, partial [Tigriopus californicus]|eukprot:TCALIF_10080-PA protein Name:"Protein of unknown function" AED:0.06 eAED:0.06 QI:85/0.5/0/1/0.5/0.33/3/0/202
MDKCGPNLKSNMDPSKEVVPFHCTHCKKTFVSLSTRRTHVSQNKCSAVPVCTEMHDHKLLREAFDTMAEAIQWYQAQELDRHFRVRDSRHDAYQYKVITVRQIEMCHCEATEPRERCFQARHRFIMEGCLTHSHPMDPDNFRLSQVTQERILGLIQSGHEVNEIVDLCNADQSQSQSKRVTLAHVYRLKRAMDRAPSKASTS